MLIRSFFSANVNDFLMQLVMKGINGHCLIFISLRLKSSSVLILIKFVPEYDDSIITVIIFPHLVGSIVSHLRSPFVKLFQVKETLIFQPDYWGL